MKHEKTKERENHTVSQPPRRTNTNPFLALLTLNMPLHLLLDNHPLALIVIARNGTPLRRRRPHPHRGPPRSIRSGRETGRRRDPRRLVRNLRMILPVLPEIVALALAHVRADGRLAAATAPFARSLRCCGRRAIAAGTLHGAQSVRGAAFFAARVTAAADLRACDDGFAAHCSEAGEKGGEEGAQAGDCRGHDCVEDFGLAADCGGDTVEGGVGGV